MALACAVTACSDLGVGGKVFACSSDDQCASGKRCDPVYKVCVAPDELTPDGDGDAPFEDAPFEDAPAEDAVSDTAEPDGAADVDAIEDATPDIEVEDSASDAGDDGIADAGPDAGETSGDTGGETDTDGGEGADGQDGGEDTGEPDADAGVPPGGCPEGMLLIQVGAELTESCVDRFEAARADATATKVGEDNQSAPKSVQGVLPWSSVTQTTAAAACATAGKRLCTMAELSGACGGAPDPITYPYGTTYKPGSCNGYASGFGKALPTGSIATCVSSSGAFDLSGNLQEWTSTTLDEGAICAFGGDYSQGAFTPAENQAQEACDPQLVQPGLICWSFDVPAVSFSNLGFRCCRDPE